MSYSSLKSSLDTALEGLGYKQNKLNLNLEESFSDKSYNVDSTIKTQNQTSDSIVSTFDINLSIGYICNSNAGLDSTIDSFVEVMTAIKNLSEFVGFTTEANYRRLDQDNKKFIFNISFDYGIRSY